MATADAQGIGNRPVHGTRPVAGWPWSYPRAAVACSAALAARSLANRRAAVDTAERGSPSRLHHIHNRAGGRRETFTRACAYSCGTFSCRRPRTSQTLRPLVGVMVCLPRPSRRWWLQPPPRHSRASQRGIYVTSKGCKQFALPLGGFARAWHACGSTRRDGVKAVGELEDIARLQSQD